MNNSRTVHVVDTSVALAVLRRETGYESAVALMTDGMISAVNYSELLAKLTDLGSPMAIAIQAAEALSLEIVPFDEAVAAAAAVLRPATRGHNISFADRACLGLAKLRQLTALTVDRAWQNLSVSLDVPVTLIR